MDRLFRMFLSTVTLVLVGGASVAWQAAAAASEDHASTTLELEGFVLDEDGGPASDALVFTSAGGRARTASDGYFRLVLDVAREAERLQVTAVGAGAGNRLASTALALTPGLRFAAVPSLTLGTSSQACSAAWLPTFGGTPWVEGGLGIRVLRAFDEGSGPALYVGGEFTAVGGQPVRGLARWDGSSWSEVGGGIDGTVLDLLVFDDGSGPSLIVAGSFTAAGGLPVPGLARWDGTNWSSLGQPGLHVLALGAFDDDGGPALYVSGRVVPSSPAAYQVARWDGASWTQVGGTFNNEVSALCSFGGELVAGGEFTTLDAVPLPYLARWDGSSWSPLGAGTSNAVQALTTLDDGSGEVLVVGGRFLSAGGLTVNRVATWDGFGWAALGTGVDLGVEDFVVHEGPGKPNLYVTGGFGSAGGVAARGIARWDGTKWHALGSGLNGLGETLALFDDGNGTALFVGGGFLQAGGVVARGLARWNAGEWSNVACGTRWVSDQVAALAQFDSGNGPELVVGGYFSHVGSMPAHMVARWNGLSWSALGNGTPSASSTLDVVRALVVHDDGSGPKLFAGGSFTEIGGLPAVNVACWDGSSWSALGTGVAGWVTGLAIFDDGSGPALYSIGIGGASRWNGSSWSALGNFSSLGSALLTFDDGSGPALYATGSFTHISGTNVNRIARWDGTSWSALGSGLNGSVSGLTTHDDGTGPVLYAGGNFTTAGGNAANYVARWDGTSWSALGSGMGRLVNCVDSADLGDGPELFAGGMFGSAPDSGDSFLARWGCAEPDTVPPTILCPELRQVPDRLGTPPGEVVTYLVRACDETDPAPTIVCTPPSGSFFPLGITLVHCTATDASGNVSECSFTVEVGKARRR